ncbi:MAG: UvrD-helicase domain-containing protein [Bacteriovoracaceae bacterium]|nr:UvrD-helicase domain-containing protein [Bacteriovoracaceae bacterium]
MSDSLELRPPNDEQKLAIEHFGGVLLSAGAGSGKTFVLVEHIIFLFNEFVKANQKLDKEAFANELRDYFSQIVLMTFTKKAAGELSLRLLKRIQLGRARSKEGLEEFSEFYWEEAERAINYLYVGTIHGFCYRLILQGYIPGFTGHEEMIGEVEFANKIDGLISLWFEKNRERIKRDHLESLVLNKKSLNNNFREIFSDTDLRVLWSNFNPKHEGIHKEVEKIEMAFEVFSGVSFDEFKFSLSDVDPSAKKAPKWFEFLEEFSKIARDREDVFSFLNNADALFSSYSRFPSASKKTAPAEAIRVIQIAKDLRDFCKKYLPDFNVLKDNFEKYQSWGEIIHEIYHFVENNYLGDNGLTFTDLEFYCSKAIQDKDIANKIQETYQYFIVDEFQDTSRVQFDIIRKILSNDMKKVFTVGDVKQAIYGFRGGELGVFKEAEKTTYQNLSLKNNYRSQSKIINFNNSLFTSLLPLGKEYVGEDSYSVPMVNQTVPEGKADGGFLNKLQVNVDSVDDKTKSLLPTELNYIEACVLFENIKQSDEETCILYRKLSPSKFLVKKLIEEQIGFTCQVKVELKEDPLICLYLEFSRACSFKNQNDELQRSTLVIGHILKFLNLGKDYSIEELTDQLSTYKTFGLMGAFKRFLWSLGLSSSNLSYNWPIINALNVLSEDNADLVFEFASGFLRGNYSLDFQYGANAQRIKIMTTHASKGLEFSKIILGGIHTNGVSKGDSGYFGKLPFSYKWLEGFSKSSTYLSPTLIYENELSKSKSFSEFKRLFYVATTRAVNTIVWVDINFKDKPASFSKNSWIEGIRTWENDLSASEMASTEEISISSSQLQLEELIPKNERLDLNRPIYHQDSLGIDFDHTKESLNLGIGAELSVTRFATLAQCPRKFFLKNVLKISPEDIEKTHSYKKSESQEFLEEKVSEVVEEGDEVFNSVSSDFWASRGTAVHGAIEFALKRNFILPNDLDLDQKALDGISWVLGELRPYKEGNKFISEEPIKFSLFGQMISGTPDLVIDGPDRLEIWDFKTGRSHGKDLSSYWMQLKTYAYALLKNRETNIKVSLILSFIDEKQNFIETYQLSDLEDQLFEKWALLSRPDTLNLNHCPQCEFEQICRNEN